MVEIKNKHPSVQDSPSYDFDILGKDSFMYHWVKEYMDATYRAVRRSGYSLEGRTLYDIGIGRGRSLALFKALGVKRVVGIDMNVQESRYAKVQQERLDVDLELIIDDVGNRYLRGVPTASSEVVSVMNLLFILPQDVRKNILEEVKRIVTPGGILVVMDGCMPSLMWFFNTLSGMGRVFSVEDKLKQLLFPLKLVQVEPSNYFYFFNRPMDILGRIFGSDIYRKMNRLMQALRVPPSTKTFVFRKL